MTDYSKVPVSYMVGGVRRYIEHGVPPGRFLFALFSNDLKEAFRGTDESNTAAMRDWVMFMVNEMPANSHGSPQEVDEWIRAGGRIGLKRRERARLTVEPTP